MTDDKTDTDNKTDAHTMLADAVAAFCRATKQTLPLTLDGSGDVLCAVTPLH